MLFMLFKKCQNLCNCQYAGTRTRVLRAEHLAAIMVQTGRDKDRQRFTTFMQEAPLDADYLQEVLTRHQLTARCNAWKPTP